MLIKSRYSARDLMMWTRRELLLFVALSTFVTALYSLAGLSFLAVPWAPIAVLGTAVAFIVGFQNNAAYDRIWEARKIWGGIVNVSRTWGMQVLDMVQASSQTEGAVRLTGKAHAELIHRHVAWLTALRHAMRASRPWERADEHFTNREWSLHLHTPERMHDIKEELCGNLPAQEWEEVLARSNKAAAILNMQSRHLTRLKDSGELWEFAYLELQQCLREMFTLQGKSERIKNFPYPRQYATLSHGFVWFFIILLPLATVPEFAKLGASLRESWPLLSEHLVWAAVPFCALLSWVFHTMERIGRVGENPFEGTANDVPISTISRGIEIDLREMLGEPSSQIPEPLPAKRDVQM